MYIQIHSIKTPSMYFSKQLAEAPPTVNELIPALFILQFVC